MNAALEKLDTEMFRQRLAGLIDPAAVIDDKDKVLNRETAITFLATLPMVFGRELNRMTLWSRIASGVEMAHAKTVGADYEFFISQVLRHIKAPRWASSSSSRLMLVMSALEAADTVARQAWLDSLVTHLDALLVHSRSHWERYLADKKSGSDLRWWGEPVDFDKIFAEVEAEGGEDNDN